jgi:ApaG protein
MKNRIIVEANSEYIPAQSNPVREEYFFSYNIKIINNSNQRAKLLSRYWHITDGLGNSEDIHGPGVVGKTPKIRPGESFSYTSFCPIKTPIGSMEGSFRLVNEDKSEFEVEVKKFKLIAHQIFN